MDVNTRDPDAKHALIADQRGRWSAGDFRRLGDYRRAGMLVGLSDEDLLDVIYSEVCLRETAGELAKETEYAAEFPDLANEIDRLFEVHRAFDSYLNQSDFPNSNSESFKPAIEAGDRVGRFTLIRLVGSGRFGEVWAATDLQLQRPVALKIPHRTTLEANANCLEEARTVAQLRHPNIVSLYDSGTTNGISYLVTELIDGLTLERTMERGRMAIKDAVRLDIKILRGLDHAHSCEIVHRDLKPSNIILDKTHEPLISDFGLAKRVASSASGEAGELAGTPLYMAPEQLLEGRAIDARCDIYAMGVILYEQLAGQRPFAGNLVELIKQAADRKPQAPSSIEKRTPRDLDAICLKALANDPDDRYQTAAEMAGDLQRFLDHRPIKARKTSLVTQAAMWSRRNVLTSLTLAGAGCVAGIAAWNRHSEATGPRTRVTIDTEPRGANITCVQLDPKTGMVESESSIHRLWGQSPVTADLPPGDYLVVADIPGYGFHEVFRKVPAIGDGKAPGSQKHLFWEVQANLIVLSKVKIPAARPVEEMALVPRRNIDVSVGAAQQSTATWIVPEFYIAKRETTVAEFQRVKYGALPNPIANQNPAIQADDAACFISYDEAVAFAEDVGLRLLDAAEFESAARLSPVNWSALERTSTFGPVGMPEEDRVGATEPIFGLHSNVAEWTSTWGAMLPEHRSTGLYLPPSETRVVHGGNRATIGGDPNCLRENRNSDARATIWRVRTERGLGLRCGLSPRPRLRFEDFVQSPATPAS